MPDEMMSFQDDLDRFVVAGQHPPPRPGTRGISFDTPLVTQKSEREGLS